MTRLAPNVQRLLLTQTIKDGLPEGYTAEFKLSESPNNENDTIIILRNGSPASVTVSIDAYVTCRVTSWNEASKTFSFGPVRRCYSERHMVLNDVLRALYSE